REFPGKVTRTSWSLNAKERTLRAEVDLPSDDILLPGMYAYVSLRGKFADRLTVPAAALLTSGDQQFCFLYEEGKARKTPVQTGLRSGNVVEILRRQVNAGGQMRWEDFSGEETLLVGNLSTLSDGQAVETRR